MWPIFITKGFQKLDKKLYVTNILSQSLSSNDFQLSTDSCTQDIILIVGEDRKNSGKWVLLFDVKTVLHLSHYDLYCPVL